MKAEFEAIQERFEALWFKHIGDREGPPWPDDERLAFLAEWNAFLAVSGWSHEEWVCALRERICRQKEQARERASR